MPTEVAIKVSADRFSERFEREARDCVAESSQHLQGPNYLVMELVEGEAPVGPLPVDEALRIAGQIADALTEAHDKGIAHAI